MPVVAAPAVAVTVASRFVVKVVFAWPAASVVAAESDRVPIVVEKFTCTDASGLPFASVTTAVISEEPPLEGTVPGLAVSCIRDAAAPPTLMVKGALSLAPPEFA